MFEYPELMDNIAGGETSIPATLIYNGVEYGVSGEFSHRWKRKEVDGQLTTDLPLETVTFMMPASQIPDIAARRNYVEFQFVIEAVQYSVRYATGTDPVTFYLVIPAETIPVPPADDEDEPQDEAGDEDDEDDGIGGIV